MRIEWEDTHQIQILFAFGSGGKKDRREQKLTLYTVMFYLLLVNLYYSLSHWHGWLDYQSFLLILDLYLERKFWKMFQNAF